MRRVRRTLSLDVHLSLPVARSEVVARDLRRGVMDVVELNRGGDECERKRDEKVGAAEHPGVPLRVHRGRHAVRRVALVLQVEELDADQPTHP